MRVGLRFGFRPVVADIRCRGELSHGVAGRIQVTEAVAAALEGRYRFEGPHLVEVKGRGPMPVWRLTA